MGQMDALDPVSVMFACDRCGANACTLTLLPPGAPDPQAPGPGAPGWMPGQDTQFADGLRLSIDGPVPNTRVLFSGVPVAVLESAMRAADAPRLYALDNEYAPQWCPDCAKNYCSSCWVIWVETDDGFYDCARGRCPENHERMIDD